MKGYCTLGAFTPLPSTDCTAQVFTEAINRGELPQFENSPGAFYCRPSAMAANTQSS